MKARYPLVMGAMSPRCERLLRGSITPHAWITAGMEAIASAHTLWVKRSERSKQRRSWRREYTTRREMREERQRAIMERTGHLRQQTGLLSLTPCPGGVKEACEKQISRSGLLLDGQVVSGGDRLAIRVMNTWVAGEVRQDYRGWYLLTTARVGIRLSAGLTARWEQP